MRKLIIVVCFVTSTPLCDMIVDVVLLIGVCMQLFSTLSFELVMRTAKAKSTFVLVPHVVYTCM